MSRRVRPSAPDQQKARTRLPTWKRPTPMRTLGVATTASTLAALPVWVTGALAVFIGQEMGFSETQHGAAVSIYCATAAVTSCFAGVVTERVGALESRRSPELWHRRAFC